MDPREKQKELRSRWKSKITYSQKDAGKIVNHWKESGKVVVFTNGCFDLLHVGHLTYLLEARSMGDKLIVGLNADESIKKLKGTGRPIHFLSERMKMLAALENVDLVVPFQEDTPLELIKLLQPHVLVKGGDYELEEIVGSDYVLKKGGKVLSLGFSKGYSTSGIIQKINNTLEDDKNKRSH